MAVDTRITPDANIESTCLTISSALRRDCSRAGCWDALVSHIVSGLNSMSIGVTRAQSGDSVVRNITANFSHSNRNCAIIFGVLPSIAVGRFKLSPTILLIISEAEVWLSSVRGGGTFFRDFNRNFLRFCLLRTLPAHVLSELIRARFRLETWDTCRSVL